MSEWQLIETAPKDGTTVFVWGPYEDEPVAVQWRRNKWMAIWDGYLVIEYQSDTRTDYRYAIDPTHWTPLPAVPERPQATHTTFAAPICPLGHDDGSPAWQQIDALFWRHRASPPTGRLRDELVNTLAWARYGEALARAWSAKAGIRKEQ